jgi:hypothetical protein
MRGAGSETVACARKENRERGVHVELSCVVGVHGALGDWLAYAFGFHCLHVERRDLMESMGTTEKNIEWWC